MAKAQINARIDSNIKELGDFGLKQAGYTPTRAICALWTYVGKHAGDSDALSNLFNTLEECAGAQKHDALETRAQRALEGSRCFDDALASMGLAYDSFCGMSDEEILEQAYFEKMTQRGVLE